MCLFLLLLVLLSPTFLCYDVLVANVFCTGSHQTVSGYLANLLSDNGHSVTYLSPNMPSYLREGVDKLKIPAHMDEIKHNLEKNDDKGVLERIQDMLSTVDHVLRSCERWYKEPEVQQIMNSGKKFDVIVVLGLFDSCSLGLASHLGINNTVINLPAPALMPNHVSMLGLPLYSSSVEFQDILIKDSTLVKTSAIARAKNLFTRLFFEYLYTGLLNWYVEPVIREHVPNYQGYHSLYERVKLVMMHAHPHPLLDGATPFGPGVLTLGGSICKPYNPDNLPPDLLNFLDSAQEGFIYLSFGSVQPDADSTEQEKWREVFESLPYKVVWKQKESQVDLPDNVRTFSWVPQMTLLQHPNIRLFITHGGFASKMEALCSGVPLLVMPKFAPDQYHTAQRIADLGLGNQIVDPYLEDTSAETLRQAIEGVISDEACRERVQGLRRQLMLTRVTDEQVLGYMDAVVAGHRFLPGYQPWYQYFYLDLLLLPIIVIVAVRVLLKKVLGRR